MVDGSEEFHQSRSRFSPAPGIAEKPRRNSFSLWLADGRLGAWSDDDDDDDLGAALFINGGRIMKDKRKEEGQAEDDEGEERRWWRRKRRRSRWRKSW